MTITPRGCLVSILLAAGVPALVAAQDGFPRRKAGLWEVSMELPGGRGMTMKSQHCIDDKTDEQAQRRALDDSPDARCQQRNVKRSASSYEAEFSCQSPQGKTDGKLKVSGDFTTRYKMDNQVRFDPPRGGMSEASMTSQALWLGACPADMKPGEIRMTGMPMGPRTDRAGRERAPPTAEQAQKMQEMLERIKQQRGGK